ncbi:spore germination protein [uncultured Ruminococcus sp.]|uniref:spore germination protein n=1 Tax=uncultured Ruminococcus sp. TaxID=165186 RepID=UPI0025EE7D95|nr:spore germination protein [uncultured Ruminococcus sp.]
MRPDFFKTTTLRAGLGESLDELKRLCGDSCDLNIMNVTVCSVGCAVVTIEGLVSTSAMADLVFQPLMQLRYCGDACDIYDYLTQKSLLSTQRQTVSAFDEIVHLLFSGFCVILIDGLTKAVAYGIQGFEKRSITTPDSEQTVRGAQDSFNEVIRNNLALVRLRMKTPELRFEMMQCGKLTKTDVCVMYISGRADPAMVRTVKKRLGEIELDTVFSSGYIEPFVDEGYRKSFFSSMMTTQRPDMTCLRLNEGRICVLVDGSPFCLVCPSLFIDSFQTMDDYCTKPYYAAFIRLLKYFAFLLAVGLPGLYLALVMFHPEAFTLKLLLNLYVSEEATPFPLAVEMTLLVVMFEIMREAGIRLPKSIGGAVSIVGGLIVGDAAVKSGLISVPLLIVVGITATSAFVIPQLDQQISVLRLVFILAGSTAGLFGIAVCTVLFTANICAMDELSVSYLSPLSPLCRSRAGGAVFRKSFRHYAKTRDTVGEFVER